jgi:hypothetical protein
MTESAAPVAPPPSRFDALFELTLRIVIVLLPLIMLFGLWLITNHETLADYMPQLSDEIYYWRQADTFRTLGIDGGNFTYGEVTARIGGYYSWGMFVPMFQGTMARLFGWSLNTIPVMNAVFLCISLGAFIWITNANRKQLLSLLIILCTFSPLILFHVTSMQEVSLLAFAALAAAAFFLLMSTGATPPLPVAFQAAFALTSVMIGAALRPTFGLLFIPGCLLLQRANTRITIGAAFAAGVLLWGVTLVAVTLTAAPFANNVFRVFANTLSSHPIEAVHLIFDNIRLNLQRLLKGEGPEVAQRLQMLLLVAGLGTSLYFRNRQGWKLSSNDLHRSEALLHFYNVGLILALYIVFYDVAGWRDLRGMAPHLFFSMLLLVAFQRRLWIVALVIPSLFALPSSGRLYATWSSTYLSPERHTMYTEWRPRLRDLFAYARDPASRWCNTVLHTGYYMLDNSPILLALPPQMSISLVLRADEVTVPVKSRYLLLDTDFFTKNPDKFPHVHALMDVPGGTLYLNRDSACHSGDAS